MAAPADAGEPELDDEPDEPDEPDELRRSDVMFIGALSILAASYLVLGSLVIMFDKYGPGSSGISHQPVELRHPRRGRRRHLGQHLGAHGATVANILAPELHLLGGARR